MSQAERLNRGQRVLAEMVAERGRPMRDRTEADLKAGGNGNARVDSDTPAFATFFCQPTGWAEKAACVGLPSSWFFPDRTNKQAVKRALEVCGGCPVRVECAQYARETDTEYGVWGGQVFRPRRVIQVAA